MSLPAAESRRHGAPQQPQRAKAGAWSSYAAGRQAALDGGRAGHGPTLLRYACAKARSFCARSGSRSRMCSSYSSSSLDASLLARARLPRRLRARCELRPLPAALVPSAQHMGDKERGRSSPVTPPRPKPAGGGPTKAECRWGGAGCGPAVCRVRSPRVCALNWAPRGRQH